MFRFPTTSGTMREDEQVELADDLEVELIDCAYANDLSYLNRARELVEIERVNVNCVSGTGKTPLIVAAEDGKVVLARLLLENDANVDWNFDGAADDDENGWTALVYAVYYGHDAMTELLLEYGADLQTPIGNCSILALAIEYQGNAAVVALLLRFGANTEETLYEGKTYSAVYLACGWANVEIVQLLLDHDDEVDVNAFVPRGHEHDDDPAMSPLCKACFRNNMEMVQLLIQRGARVIYNGLYPDVPCPLKHAVEYGSLELVQYLLDQTNLQREVGNDNHPLSPALETAVRSNEMEAAQLLVDRGANVNDRAFLWQCTNYEPNRWHPRDYRIGIVRLLLRAAGANVNLAEPERGETPLWAAAKNGHVEMVKELLKAEANVKICDNHGDTPLEVARRNGHKGIMYLLLRASPHVWSKLDVGLIPVSIILKQLRAENARLHAENKSLKSQVVAAASDSSS